MILKLKLQYFGHLMQRVDSLEKTLMLGGIGGRRSRELDKKFLQSAWKLTRGPTVPTDHYDRRVEWGNWHSLGVFDMS